MMAKKIRNAIKVVFIILSVTYLTYSSVYAADFPLVQRQKNINETAKVLQKLAQYDIAMRGFFTDKGAMKALDAHNELILKPFDSSLKTRLVPDVKETSRKIYDKKKEFLQHTAHQV